MDLAVWTCTIPTVDTLIYTHQFKVYISKYITIVEHIDCQRFVLYILKIGKLDID